MKSFDTLLQELAAGTLTAAEVESACVNNQDSLALKIALANQEAGAFSGSQSQGLINVLEFTFFSIPDDTTYRYHVGDTDETGTVGIVNRWEVGVGAAGSSAWTVTKPVTQVALEALTYA